MRFAIIIFMLFVSCSVQVMTIQKNDHLQNDPCIRIIKEEPVKTNQEFKQVFYIDKCR